MDGRDSMAAATRRRLQLDPSKLLGFNATHPMIGSPDLPLTLSPASDTGYTEDDATTDTTPTIIGSGETAGDTIRLYNNSTTLLGTTTVLSDGSWSITTGPLAVGSYSLTGSEYTPGNVFTAGTYTPLALVIDPIPPVAFNLTLDPSTDSGTVGDGITSSTAPVIDGNGVAGDYIDLYDGSTYLGYTTVGGEGTWSIATSGLTSRIHSFTAVQSDPDGNYAAASTALSVTINAVPLAAANLALAPVSDTGTRGDSTTTVAAPVIMGTGEAGDTVTLSTGGTQIGSATVAANGEWSVATTGPLALGTHLVTAVQANMFGTVGPVSSALSLTIGATVVGTAPVAPTLLFTDGSDQTVYATDGSSTIAVGNAATTPIVANASVNQSAISAVSLGSDSYLVMADTTGTTSALYRYDGTTISQVTSSLNYVNTATDYNQSNNAQPLTTYNGDVVFAEDTLANGAAAGSPYTTAKLAIYDPTTSTVSDLVVPNGGTDPEGFTQLGADLYFIGTDTTANAKALYRYDGTSVVEVSNANNPTGAIAAFNGKIYFGSTTETVFQYDPGTSTESRVAQLYPYNPGTSATNFIVYSNHLYALSPTTGVYSFNTSNASTVFVESIGALEFTPVLYNNLLYYVTDHLNGDNTALVPALYSYNGTSSTLVSDNVDPRSLTAALGKLYVQDGNASTLDSYNVTTPNTLAVPGGAGNYIPLVVAPFALPDTPWSTPSTAVTVSSVTASPGTAALDAGQTVTFTLAMSAAVTVAGGTPTLTLNDGGIASYQPTASTDTNLVFTYLVAPGDNTPDLTATGVVLNGATIEDAGSAAADLIGALANPAGTLQIDTIAPTAAPASLTASENAPATIIGIPEPTDPGETAKALTVTIATLPGNGVVTLGDGVTAVGIGSLLNSDQLGGLLFKPTTGLFDSSSTLTYSVTDPAGNASTGSATLAIGPAIGDPVASSPAPVTVAAATSGNAIGIEAPTDPNYATEQLTITVGTLPSNGVVTLADGITPVTGGDVLTAAQLTGLLFTATAGQSSTSSAFTYIVADPADNTSAGGVTLSVGPVAPSSATLAASSDSGTAGDGITNVAMPAIVGTGTPGDSVSLYDGAGVDPIGTTIVALDGSWSITPEVALTEGAHLLTTTQSYAGAASPASTPFGLTIDTTLPDTLPAPVLAPASDSGTLGDDITSATTPTIAGSGTTGDSVSLYDGKLLIGTGTVVDGSWSIIPAVALVDGIHNLTATQTDAAGNVSIASGPLALTIDSIVPDMLATPLLAPASDSGIPDDDLTNATTPAITGSGAIGNIVSLYDGGILIGTGTVTADGSWSITPAVALIDGLHPLTATQTDAAGNVSVASDPLPLTIDTTLPDTLATPLLAPASDSGTPGDDLTNATNPTITGSGITGDTISLYDGKSLIGTGTVVDGSWSITPAVALANGLHPLTATQTDTAGNVSAASSELGLTIDNAILATPADLALAAASDSGAAGDDLTNVVTPAITGSGITGNSVSLYDDNVLIGTATVVDGSWSITPLVALVDGLHPLTATQTDAAGNISAASDPLPLTIDSTLPDSLGTPVLAPASDSGTLGDDLTNSTIPAITGSGVIGDSVSLYDDGVLIGTGTVTADGSWSITPLVALVNGLHPLTATQTDGAGNVSAASGPLPLTVDTTLPDTLGTPVLAPASDSGTPGDDLTNSTIPAITGTGIIGDSVSLYDDGVLIGTGTVTADGSWSITPAVALIDGLHPLTATQTDAAGNVSAASGPLPLTIDTTLPDTLPAPVLDPASDSGTLGDDITSATTPTITGSGTTGDSVSLYDGKLLIGTGTVVDGSWSITPAVALGDGIHALTATTTDAIGNVSLPSAALSLAIETMAPNAPANLALAAASDSGRIGDDLTSVAAPAITGTGTAGDTISLHDGATVIGTAIVAANGIWSVIPATALADGVHSLLVTTTDVAGNVSAASDILQLTIDTTTPPAPTGLLLATASDSGLGGDDLTSITTPTITGMGIAGDTVTLRDGSSLLGSAIVAADGSWSVTPAVALAEGVHSLTATDTNAAGTTSAASTTLSLAIDITASAAPGNLALAQASDSGTPGDDLTNVTRPAILGTGTPGETISLLDGSGQVGTAIVAQDGSWSIVPASPLADGVHSLTATTMDAAGNTSAASTVFSLTIDSTAPAAPTRLSLAAASDSGTLGDDLTSVNRPAIHGTGTAGETISLYDGASLLGTATAAGNGSWSITPTVALADGPHSLTATTTDAAGNISTASAPLALGIDTSAATAPTLTQTASNTASASPVLTGNADPGSSVDLYDGDIRLGTATASASGLYSYAVTAALSVGTHLLTAKETDLAGNVSAASAVLTVTINADSSYAIVSPPASNGDVVSRVYDSSGQYTSADTTDSTGLLLQSVSPTSTLRNIYDSAGKLIGTVGEAGSASSIAQPDFTTDRLTGGAITVTDATASLVTLLSEDHSLTLQGNDTVVIGSGDDTISAGSGSASVTGGSGRLTFYGNDGTSTVTGGTGSATIVGGSGGGVYAGGSSAGNLLAAAAGNTTLVGGSSHDVMFGGSGDNVILGSSTGSDTIVAGSGSNLIAASDNDVVFTAGQSTVNGSAAGGDTIIGGSGSAVMVAGGGSNVLFGGAGNDTLYGGSGTNVLVGGAGSSVMVGTAGSTDFVGGSGQSTVFGGAGNDTVWSGIGTMTAVLGDGADTVILGPGNASVFGGLGRDVYDVINGQAGGNDMIAGFKAGTDQIALYGYSTSAVQTTSGGSTILDLSDGTRITLLAVTDLKNSVV